ncbi:hypothetical protein QYF36_009811 [Acer negundo]|nr:hypothetical protein QYF36_009811 [Acer negundo]
MWSSTQNPVTELARIGIAIVLVAASVPEKNEKEGTVTLPEFVYEEVVQTTSSIGGFDPHLRGSIDPLSSSGLIPITVGTSAGASLSSEGLISPLEMMMAMTSGHAYLGDGDWDWERSCFFFDRPQYIFNNNVCISVPFTS